MDNHGRWLKDQLDEWSAEGLISAEAAKELRRRYGGGASFSWAAALFTAALFCLTAGLFFTGAGLWSTLSQDERFLLAVGPLAVSDLLAVIFWAGDGAIRRFPDFLREGVGLFHGLAVTAAVWIVHDSFLLDADISGLLLAVALTLLMMLYILRSAGLGIIFCANAALAAWLHPANGWFDGAVWLLLAAAFPFFLVLIGSNRQTAGIAFAWGWIASVLALTFVTASGQIWQVVFFASVASLTWLIGAALRPYGWIGAAFRFFGGAAVFGVLFAASFGATWRDGAGDWFLWTLLVLFLAADGVLLVKAAVSREWLSITAGLTPFVMAAAVGLSLWDGTGVSSAVLVTCFMAFLALAVILQGLRKGRNWQIASGLVLLLSAGGVRLWDATLSFAQRGNFFFAAGIVAALLCLIFFLPRRKKRRRIGKRPRKAEAAPVEAPAPYAERQVHEEAAPSYKPAGPWRAPEAAPAIEETALYEDSMPYGEKFPHDEPSFSSGAGPAENARSGSEGRNEP